MGLFRRTKAPENLSNSNLLVRSEGSGQQITLIKDVQLPSSDSVLFFLGAMSEARAKQFMRVLEDKLAHESGIMFPKISPGELIWSLVQGLNHDADSLFPERKWVCVLGYKLYELRLRNHVAGETAEIIKCAKLSLTTGKPLEFLYCSASSEQRLGKFTVSNYCVNVLSMDEYGFNAMTPRGRRRFLWNRVSLATTLSDSAPIESERVVRVDFRRGVMRVGAKRIPKNGSISIMLGEHLGHGLVKFPVPFMDLMQVAPSEELMQYPYGNS